MRQAQPDVDMMARLSQEVEAGLSDFLSYQDAGHGGHGPTKGISGPVAFEVLRPAGPAGPLAGWGHTAPLIGVQR